MSDIAIRIERLSKLYRIGQRERYKTLRDTLTDALYAPVRRLCAVVQSSRLPASQHPDGDSTIWALQDVSFEVKQGEVVGIIGRNGAGKSTLLKILSRITKPTEGRAEIYGRVGSLLEVGTGFHPELTGRENIYLNGSILGMKRAEIERQFDEMVAFAEVEKFIDTPVKHYSSGMYVRLAFAVAAHLEPEILLVDEVLAVGDAAFQKKCLGKMGEVAKEGRTVLFVSHNMAAIALLCREAIWLQNGQVTGRGPSRHIVEQYLSLGSHRSAEVIWAFEDAPSSELVKLHAVKVCGANGQASFDQRCGAPIRLSMEFWCLRQTKVTPSFHIYNQSGILLFPTANLHADGWNQRVYQPGLYRASCMIPAPLLNAGTYFVHAFLSRDTDGMPYVHVPEVVSFQVIDDGTGRGNYIGEYYPGLFRPLLSWTGERLADLPFLYAQHSML